jgi:catechol 2,3-dioxygenase-like lactoylglutathione lyase family enzyme
VLAGHVAELLPATVARIFSGLSGCTGNFDTHRILLARSASGGACLAGKRRRPAGAALCFQAQPELARTERPCCVRCLLPAALEAYIVPMTAALESMVASTYVRDLDVSRDFYELLGFREQSTGRAPTSGWCYLQLGGHYVLLATTRPALDLPRLPLLFYFFFDDVDAVTAALRAGGRTTVHLGYPPHAAGGEVKVLDPDGNTVLLGQRERSPLQDAPAEDAGAWFSLRKEAAAMVEGKDGPAHSCQVNGTGPAQCTAKAEVKLADTAGTTSWACLAHAEEALLSVHGAFIASPDDEGLAAFLRSHRG